MSLPYSPPAPLDCAAIRAVDARAITVLGVPGLILMENAARGAAEAIHNELLRHTPGDVVVLCGPGNNGGDGFAIARHLAAAGYAASIILAAPPDTIRGDAAANLRMAEQIGIPAVAAYDDRHWDEVAKRMRGAAVVVDALLGTGSRGAPTGAIARLIDIANDVSNAVKVAVDIPTGMNGDSGEASSPCFRADVTVTFVAEKIGFRSESARRVLGRVVVVGLGVPLKNLLGDSNSA